MVEAVIEQGLTLDLHAFTDSKVIIAPNGTSRKRVDDASVVPVCTVCLRSFVESESGGLIR